MSSSNFDNFNDAVDAQNNAVQGITTAWIVGIVVIIVSVIVAIAIVSFYLIRRRRRQRERNNIPPPDSNMVSNIQASGPVYNNNYDPNNPNYYQQYQPQQQQQNWRSEAQGDLPPQRAEVPNSEVPAGNYYQPTISSATDTSSEIKPWHQSSSSPQPPTSQQQQQQTAWYNQPPAAPQAELGTDLPTRELAGDSTYYHNNQNQRQ